MSKIVLADDHLIVAQGVASLLEPEHEVLAIAQSGEELIQLVKLHKPELVITDISMPGMTGIAAVARAEHWQVRARLHQVAHVQVQVEARHLVQGGPCDVRQTKSQAWGGTS